MDGQTRAFLRPYRAERVFLCFAAPPGQSSPGILTQAEAGWAMLSWPFGPQYHRGAQGLLTGSGRPEGPRKLSPGFSLGKHKKTFGPEVGWRDALVYRGQRHT
jgi:hypothetical protein